VDPQCANRANDPGGIRRETHARIAPVAHRLTPRSEIVRHRTDARRGWRHSPPSADLNLAPCSATPILGLVSLPPTSTPPPAIRVAPATIEPLDPASTRIAQRDPNMHSPNSSQPTEQPAGGSHPSAPASGLSPLSPGPADERPIVFQRPISTFVASQRIAHYGAVLIAAAAASACASAPAGTPPELTRAESAITQAERAGAAQLAPAPYRMAWEKQQAATAAYGRRDLPRTIPLAEAAGADARLAELSAPRAKSLAIAADVDLSVRTLERQATHAPPGDAAAPVITQI
jgi:hypothetical protein